MIVTAPRNRLPIGLENKYICRSNNELQEVGRRRSTGIWEEQSNSKRRFEMYISNGMHGGVRGRRKSVLFDTKPARKRGAANDECFLKSICFSREYRMRAHFVKEISKIKKYFGTAVYVKYGECTTQKNKLCRIMAYEVERPSFFVERGRFSCLNMTSFVCVIWVMCRN